MTSWREDALCRQVDAGEMFFPGAGESTAPAKRVCAGCDVRAECLDEALIENMQYGVWGGTTERERRVLRKQRGLARRAVPAAVRTPEPGEAA